MTFFSSLPRKREPRPRFFHWVPAFAGMTRVGMLAVALFTTAPLLADSDMPPAYWSDRQLPDPREEAEAQALMQEIRCLVCQGQSIADSDAELAGDMRDLVRRRIEAGEKPSAIRAWLIQRYGNWISLKPPVTPIAWPLWLAPLVLLGAGGVIAATRLKRRGG